MWIIIILYILPNQQHYCVTSYDISPPSIQTNQEPSRKDTRIGIPFYFVCHCSRPWASVTNHPYLYPSRKVLLNVEVYSLSRNIQPAQSRECKYLSQICLTLEPSSFYYMLLLLYKYVLLVDICLLDWELYKAVSGLWYLELLKALSVPTALRSIRPAPPPKLIHICWLYEQMNKQ